VTSTPCHSSHAVTPHTLPEARAPGTATTAASRIPRQLSLARDTPLAPSLAAISRRSLARRSLHHLRLRIGSPPRDARSSFRRALPPAPLLLRAMRADSPVSRSPCSDRSARNGAPLCPMWRGGAHRGPCLLARSLTRSPTACRSAPGSRGRRGCSRSERARRRPRPPCQSGRCHTHETGRQSPSSRRQT